MKILLCAFVLGLALPLSALALGDTGPMSVAAGDSVSFALALDGTLWGFGAGAEGQLGYGHRDQYSPTMVMDGVSSVSSGLRHTLVVRTDGTLWGFGNGYEGQLGPSVYETTSQPVQIASGIAAASAGGTHSLFLDLDGNVYSLGGGELGQLGNGDFDNASEPQWVMDNVRQISAGVNHSLVVTLDGELYGFGAAEWGQIVDLYDSPYPVYICDGVLSASAGAEYSLVLLETGELLGFGRNDRGQLTLSGVTEIESSMPEDEFAPDLEGFGVTPTDIVDWPVMILDSVSAYAAGRAGGAAVSNGVLYTFGSADYGLSGNSAQADQYTPGAVRILSAADVLSVFEHALAVRSDNTLWVWGSNLHGCLGVGNTSFRSDDGRLIEDRSVYQPVYLLSDVSSAALPIRPETSLPPPMETRASNGEQSGEGSSSPDGTTGGSTEGFERITLGTGVSATTSAGSGGHLPKSGLEAYTGEKGDVGLVFVAILVTAMAIPLLLYLMKKFRSRKGGKP